MLKPPVEKRAKGKKRLPVSLACQYSAGQAQGGEATTFDISEGGMCFYSNKPVDIGYTIEVQCKELWDSPKHGVVRWCQRIHHRLYRVGVQFVDSKP